MAQNPLDLPKLYAVLAEYATTLQTAYRKKITEEGHKASGLLQRTCEWRIDYSGRHYIISLNLQDYWKDLEDGKVPGTWVSLSKLREWIRVKPVVPYRDKDGNLPTIKQLASLIKWKIHEKGIAPTYILDRTIEQVNKEYFDKIKKAFAEDMQTSLRATFTDVFRK